MTQINDEQAHPAREQEFARKESLEGLLGSISRDLSVAENQAIAPFRGHAPELPPIFIMGAPRCGSTLFMQWLASLGQFAYPTNVLSRFWAAPIIGARIQKLLFDPAYDFRDELADLKGSTDFVSHHGKTAGALSPNEFWYFWRRFLPGNDYHPDAELEQSVDIDTMKAELAGLSDVLDKPFATKGMIFNENIPFMARHLPNAIFIWVRRKPEFNVQSLLKARERQYGDVRQWYSFRIRNYPQLKDLPPVESVCGQIASIHNALASGLAALPTANALTVDYDEFCRSPGAIYTQLRKRLTEHGCDIAEYTGPGQFTSRDAWRLGWVSLAQVSEMWQRMQECPVASESREADAKRT